MSITSTDALHATPKEDATLSHMVRWLHEMYSAGKDPFASLNKQARMTGEPLERMYYAMTIACVPGGHGPEVERSKRRFIRQYNEIKNERWKKAEGK